MKASERAPRTFGDLRFVLLWSDEHCAWWRPEGMGYTKRLEEAGLYDPDTVVQRWLHGGSKFVHVVRLGATVPRRRKLKAGGGLLSISQPWNYGKAAPRQRRRGRLLPKRTCPRCGRLVSIMSNITRDELRAHMCPHRMRCRTNRLSSGRVATVCTKCSETHRGQESPALAGSDPK